MSTDDVDTHNDGCRASLELRLPLRLTLWLAGARRLTLRVEGAQLNELNVVLQIGVRRDSLATLGAIAKGPGHHKAPALPLTHALQTLIPRVDAISRAENELERLRASVERGGEHLLALDQLTHVMHLHCRPRLRDTSAVVWDMHLLHGELDRLVGRSDSHFLLLGRLRLLLSGLQRVAPLDEQRLKLANLGERFGVVARLLRNTS
mmetsp:Transcript_40693/g.86728  ORF Transcript_40693/g.86728 Transcript_40693/m.86728 type:complete len:206 (-) Transcript_40693:125-742(-)